MQNEILPNEQVIPPTYKDIIFAIASLDDGTYLDLKMNIYKPQNVNLPAPALLYIFGGAWIRGDYTQQTSKPMNWQVPLSLVQQGITFVSIDYRRANEAIFPVQLYDVKGAIRFLRAHAEEYGIDANRIGVWGVSAGGHLAALAATTWHVQEMEGTVGGNLEQSSRVTAAVAIYPAIDILRMSEDMEPHILSCELASEMHDSCDSPEAFLFGFHQPGQGMGVLRTICDRQQINSPYWDKVKLVEKSNPVYWASKHCPPMLILNGARDEKAAWQQSVKLFRALSRAGVPAVYLSDAQAGHDHTTFQPELLEMALRFMCNKLIQG